jgi:hypothetical protein
VGDVSGMVGFKRIMIACLWAISILGCLRTRDVEPPDQQNSDWVSPVDYTTLLDNLKRSVSQLNVQNYLRCFRADGFVFVPSTPVFTGNELIWGDWSWQDEQTWFNNINENIGLSNGNSLQLQEVGLQSFAADSIRYVADYRLRMNHTDTSLTVEFAGQAEFLFQLNSYNEWEISKWVDFETKVDSSWSRLKLNYVQ